MNNMLKKEIYVAVIAAILATIFFEPIIRWIWGAITWFGIQTYSGILNQIYLNAALGRRNHIDLIVYILIVIAIMEIPVLVLTDFANSNTVSRLVARLKKLSKKAQKTIKFVLAAIVVVSGLFLILINFADLQLNTSFEQRLTVLAPVLSEQDYKEIRASWASMESREDFVSINSKMDDLAEQYGIELPKLLLP